MQFKVAGLLIDLDGTLLDTERLFTECLIEAVSKHHLNLPWNVACTLIGLNEEQSRIHLKNLYGNKFPLSSIEKLAFEIFDSLLESDTPLKPGAKRLFETLAKLEVPFAIATNRNSKSAIKLLNNSCLIGFNIKVFGGDLVKQGKPNPEILLLAAKALNLNCEHCLVVEDSDVGIMAAIQTKAKIAVIPDLAVNSPNLLCMCDLILSSLTKLNEILPNLLYNK